MDMQKCTIYIRAYKRTTIQVKRLVTIGEVADVAAPSEVKARIECMPIFHIPQTNKKGRYVISVIEVINKIWESYPKADIQSVGDPDMVIHYVPKYLKKHAVWEWTKVVMICIVIFAGATVAVMAYNTDVSMGETFIILNRIFTGEQVDNPYYLTVPYAIGVASGVLVFFNHFGRKKITQDPSPMQVEINMYEKDVADSEIDHITDKRRGEP